MSAARADAELVDWVGDGDLALADLGYEGEPSLFRIPVKKPADATLTVDQQVYNAIHGALRCLGEPHDPHGLITQRHEQLLGKPH